VTDLNINTIGINAETLVSLLDIREDDINVRAKGVFFRNYSNDLMKIENNEDKTTIALARDGIFHLLPQGLYFKENQLKVRPSEFEDAHSKLKKVKKKALSFFQPFDTEYFKLTLEFEHKLNDFAKTGNNIFSSFLEENAKIDTKNRYISKLKKMLPFASQLRGNLPLLIDILKNTLSIEKIEIKKIKHFHLRFIIHKEGLTKEEYLDMDKELQPFFDFFRHWYLPVEQYYDYRIKDYKQPFKLENSLILDYNTHL